MHFKYFFNLMAAFFFQKRTGQTRQSTKNVFILKIYHQTEDDYYKILRGEFRLGSLSHSPSSIWTGNTELSHEMTQCPIYKYGFGSFCPMIVNCLIFILEKLCKTHERNGVISLVRQSLIRRSLFR